MNTLGQLFTGSDSATQAVRAPVGEYLSFCLGAEEYGIEILKVQEIRGYQQPTRLAGAPDCVGGVLNLRGVVVPVVDLRVRFGIEPRVDAVTVTVVLNVRGRTVGMVVDSVSDVTALNAEQLRPMPEVSSAADTGHITGIGCIRRGERERLLILLDVEQLVADIGLTGTAPAFH